VEAWEIEQLLRSIAILAPATRLALTKDAAMALVHGVLTCRRETERYRQAVAELR
jgi:hypothetical protein